MPKIKFTFDEWYKVSIRREVVVDGPEDDVDDIDEWAWDNEEAAYQTLPEIVLSTNSGDIIDQEFDDYDPNWEFADGS
jgi:hypothetical protein